MDPTLDSQTPGRVNLEAEHAGNIARLPGFQYTTTGSSTAGADGIRGNWDVNLLNQTFFSQANFEIVQNKIRYDVYTKTGRVIDKQSTDDLFMIMRAIYLQYGRNLDTHIREQIEELNQRVTDWCLPKIISEINMYETYLKDISAMPIPLSHPTVMNTAGTRSKPFKPFFEPEEDEGPF